MNKNQNRCLRGRTTTSSHGGRSLLSILLVLGLAVFHLLVTATATATDSSSSSDDNDADMKLIMMMQKKDQSTTTMMMTMMKKSTKQQRKTIVSMEQKKKQYLQQLHLQKQQQLLEHQRDLHHATARSGGGGEGGGAGHHLDNQEDGDDDGKREGDEEDGESYIDTEDISHHQQYEYGEVYQLGAELCFNMACYDAEFQIDNVLVPQLELIVEQSEQEEHYHSQLRTDCRDIWPDCAERLQQVLPLISNGNNKSGEACPRDSKLLSYCAQTCQSCFRTYPLQLDPHRERRSKHYTPSSKMEAMYSVILDAYIGNIEGEAQLDLGVPQLDVNMSQSDKTGEYTKSDKITATTTDGARPKTLVQQHLEKTHEYMTSLVMFDDLYIPVRSTCRNQHEMCTAWASQGLCETSLSQRQLQMCGPACETCHLLDYLSKCPVDYHEPHALYPGDLHALFETIVDTYSSSHYRVTVASQPKFLSSSSTAAAAKKKKKKNNNNQHDGDRDDPWLLVIDNFLDEEEANYLIQAATTAGYQQSYTSSSGWEKNVSWARHDGDYGRRPQRHPSKNRAVSLSTVWCTKQNCEPNPLAQRLLEKLEQLTGIDRAYYEYLQLLRYTHDNNDSDNDSKGEEDQLLFPRQHDYIPEQQWRMVGARVMTIFLFLNTVGDNDAGIEFPQLGLDIGARLGRAVVWPNVLNEDPHAEDERMQYYHYHGRNKKNGNKGGGANSAKEIMLYGANVWIHQRKFRVAHDKGC